ncbi:uncharacterized protein LOC131612025 isoform X2 [Vicia villosa]|uniref:uncharacterized protein LOC131612025 isoform X2 n=1 Tax=Vicia villosa TaxID=3911 RepID=UPI00273B5D3C|nr:uncharacterized protein LOC131612025 isoform X2 [Vicia villosa]
MPITPCDSQIPLPSPIPTGRGSRSAANEIFSKFLEKKLHLPELTLPELHQPPAPAEIDLWSLPLASASLLQRSAKEFGAFRIRSHGISSYDLETIAKEAEVVFKDTRKVYVERNGRCGGMIPCVRSSNGELEFTARNQTHRKFWVHMGYIASRLDAIVDQVTLALKQDASQDFKERIQETESVICLCRSRGYSCHRWRAIRGLEQRCIQMCSW